MSLILSGTDGLSDVDGSASTPAIRGTDTNTGIFFPAVDTIAFAEGGTEVMRIDSDGDVGIGTSSPSRRLTTQFDSATTYSSTDFDATSNQLFLRNANTTTNAFTGVQFLVGTNGEAAISATRTGDGEAALAFGTRGGGSRLERMRIDSSGNVGIGTISPSYKLDLLRSGSGIVGQWGKDTIYGQLYVDGQRIGMQGTRSSDSATTGVYIENPGSTGTSNFELIAFRTTGSERARITSGGEFLVGNTAVNSANNGFIVLSSGRTYITVTDLPVLTLNRKTTDGTLISFQQDTTEEGTISVSGNTVSYNGFSGGHWTQLPEGRGYNPDILRGTVMSSIGEMCEWKSVTWTETIEHPAVPAVEAKEAVVDEEGNVVEPAVEAIEGKNAWTETINKREAYLGNLAVGATFEEDGVTKTVVDDGNERLPKVKISDVVGDKAVYGVFQTYDEVQDMLVTSLGAFVVRIAAGVTVQIGDLLESNGDGCAKVQDDDVIRSKTIGKVTSTVATATYPDGSYTVPCVIYCG